MLSAGYFLAAQLLSSATDSYHWTYSAAISDPKLRSSARVVLFLVAALLLCALWFCPGRTWLLLYCISFVALAEVPLEPRAEAAHVSLASAAFIVRTLLVWVLLSRMQNHALLGTYLLLSLLFGVLAASAPSLPTAGSGIGADATALGASAAELFLNVIFWWVVLVSSTACSK